MNKAWNKLKEAWEENPVMVLVVGAFTATAAAKVLHEVNAAKANRTWAKEVDRRNRVVSL